MRSSARAKLDGRLYRTMASLGLPARPSELAMIISRQRRVPISLPPLQHFFERARREATLPPEAVTVRLISDDAMASLNQTFRNDPKSRRMSLSFPAKVHLKAGD